MKMKDQTAGSKIVGRENTGHENARHKITGPHNARINILDL